MVKTNFIIKSFTWAGNEGQVALLNNWLDLVQNSAGQKDTMCYYGDAFVALVTPLDSILEGLRVQTRGLFCFTAGGSRAAANNLNKE
jgi:hypothetical protein